MKLSCHPIRVTLFFLLLFMNQNLFGQSTSLCDSAVGDWNWFTGYVVTIRADGTVVHNPGNSGTWQCTDATRGEFIIKWNVGGYNNKMGLSPDRNSLFSIDPTQSFVKATRIPPFPEVPSESKPAPPPAQNQTPPAPPAPVQTPVYNISPEDSKELARLMKRMSGDYTYTKQTHWPDGSVYDDGYLIATMSLTLNNDFTLVQKSLKCKVSNPRWRTDGYVMSSSTQKDCDKNLHGLKWQEETGTAPLGKVDPASIGIVELDKHGSDVNLGLSIGYEGYDPNKAVAFDEEEEDDKEDEKDITILIKTPPGFTILHCRNRGTCGQMAADLNSIVGIAKKYVPPTPVKKP